MTLADGQSTGQIDSQTVNRAHFGGFDDEEEDEDGVCILKSANNHPSLTFMHPNSPRERSQKPK